MNKLTDFNDMAKLSGLEAVKLAIDAAKPVEQKTDPVHHDVCRCDGAVARLVEERPWLSTLFQSAKLAQVFQAAIPMH
ncbi:MAG: hypothetical protein Q7J38_07745 [Gallionella sp.]|nr:hypothetical protein [Gallionella sp.]